MKPKRYVKQELQSQMIVNSLQIKSVIFKSIKVFCSNSQEAPRKMINKKVLQKLKMNDLKQKN